MKLQEVIFPSQNDENLMFFRRKEGELSLDTYFNSFSYTKYRDYTKVKNVTFSCRFHGSAIVQLCAYDGTENVITQGNFTDDAALEVGFSKLPENGFLYPKFIFKSDFEFFSGEYSSNVQPEKINVCIAICTYKREQFVLKNIELLKSFKFSFINRVFVIDNGKTLDQNALSDDFLKVLPNKNYGGSGGFTRGLIEAYDGGYSHIILMDDDIEFRPETLEQMTALVSMLKDEFKSAWIGTGMFPLDRRWEQWALGEDWKGKTISYKHLLDLRERTGLLDNLNNIDSFDYSAWWTICMPVSVVENGLPFPFFIKVDDIEYGMRRKANTRIITMNGIGVFHEAFDKKESLHMVYYMRNELIVGTIYKTFGLSGIIKRFCREVAKHLALYRYDSCGLIIKSAENYLSGVDFFINTDEEKLNTELIESVPKLVPLADIPQWNDALKQNSSETDKIISLKMKLLLGGYLIPAPFLKKEIKAFSLSHPRLCDIFGRKTVIQYQLSDDKGIVTERSFGKFLKYSMLTVKTVFKLFFGFKRIFRDYTSRKDEITSFKFWRDHLNIIDV